MFRRPAVAQEPRDGDLQRRGGRLRPPVKQPLRRIIALRLRQPVRIFSEQNLPERIATSGRLMPAAVNTSMISSSAETAVTTGCRMAADDAVDLSALRKHFMNGRKPQMHNFTIDTFSGVSEGVSYSLCYRFDSAKRAHRIPRRNVLDGNRRH